MRTALPLFALGLALVGVAIAIDQQQRALQQADRHGIAALRAELDSVRSALARSADASESSRLAQSVAQRTYLLGRREFHVPSRQERLDRWWTLLGPGTVLATIGSLLMVIAGAAWLRARGLPKLAADGRN